MTISPEVSVKLGTTFFLSKPSPVLQECKGGKRRKTNTPKTKWKGDKPKNPWRRRDLSVGVSPERWWQQGQLKGKNAQIGRCQEIRSTDLRRRVLVSFQITGWQTRPSGLLTDVSQNPRHKVFPKTRVIFVSFWETVPLVWREDEKDLISFSPSSWQTQKNLGSHWEKDNKTSSFSPSCQGGLPPAAAISNYPIE